MSAFWERKMRTYFRHFDYNEDGFLTAKDYEDIATRFSDRGKVDDAKRQQMSELLQKVYEILSHGVAGELTARSFTEADFVTHFKVHLTDPKLFEHMKIIFAATLELSFKIIDINGDGVIEPYEYAIFFENVLIDPKYAEDSFRAIDTDKDGHLSCEEFVAAGVEFFTSQDETLPSQVFWGPLID